MKHLDNKSLEEQKPPLDRIDPKGNFGRQNSQPGLKQPGSQQYRPQPSQPKPSATKPWSNLEKNNLSKKLRTLSPNSLRGVLKIIKNTQPSKNGVVEFDINKLTPDMCFQLDSYVNEVQQRKQIQDRPLSSMNVGGGASRTAGHQLDDESDSGKSFS